MVSQVDKVKLREIGSFYENAGDQIVFDHMEMLKREVGEIEGWKTTKELARKELAQVPDDILEQLLERFTPFIQSLPPGHSRGHFLRDSAYLTAIFQDPEIHNFDAVEVFVGMLGGVYHDVGNSVVGRYDEQRRLSGHAEVGAHLFGVTAKDLLGENLIKLTQLVIAGHTHYTKERTVSAHGEVRTTTPYTDSVEEGNRMAYWWARQSDRCDAQGPVHGIRHILTKAEPTEDFDGKEHHAVWENPQDDFDHQFQTKMRSDEMRTGEVKPANTMNVLEHITMYARSNFNPNLPYSRYDNPTLRQLITAGAEEQLEFATDVLTETQTLPEGVRNDIFQKYFERCASVEPSDRTSEVLTMLQDKFTHLSESDQSKWARGMKGVVDRLYPRMWSRMNEILKNKPQTLSGSSDAEMKVQEILSNHLHPLAQEIWRIFKPQ